MASKDTGTGGINIGGDLYSADVGVPDDQGGKQGAWSSGDVAVDKSIKDFSKPTLTKLGQYMSKTTLQQQGSSTHPNAYPVGSGDATVVQPLSLNDAAGNPATPGQSPNAAKFAPAFDTQMGVPAPLLIKKGIASGNNPDGNQLLPGAAEPAASGAPYIKPAKELNDPIKSYTKNELDPNLYSPLDNPLTPNVVIGDGGQIAANNIRPLHVTTGLATDGGASTGIFTPNENHTLTPEKAAKKAKTETENNFYPVVVAETVSFVKPSAKDVLADPSDANKFADVQIGVVSPAKELAKKGKLEQGAQGAKNGNYLLSTIAPIDNVTKLSKLTTLAQTYTNNVVDPNLNNYNTTPVVISAGGLNVSPSSLRDIKIVSNFADDAGTSKNILGPDGNQGLHALTLIKAENLANVTTSAASDGTKNKYVVDATADPSKASTVTLRGADGHPVSVTAAQNNPTNSSFFSSKIQTSYTTAYVTAIADPTPFLIKRGKESGVDAAAKDGNELLPGVSSALPAGLQTYTSAVLKPNLETAYDPRVLPSSGADPAGADIGSTSGIKFLHNPSSFPVDGGNSANVLSAASSKSLNQLATVVHDKTADNAYPVDSPVVAGKLTMFSLDSSVVLADPSNDKKFADVKIGSSPFISKGKLVNKDADNKNLPNGNTLLPSAATLADPGAPYIKPAKELNDPINSYTKSALDPNLYSPLDNPLTPNVVIGDGELGPQNARTDFKVPTSMAADGGTSKNILSPDDAQGSHTLTFEQTAELAYKATNAAPGTELPNAYTVDKYDKSLSITGIIDQNGYPASATHDQDNPKNSSQFAAVGVLKNSYTDALIGANFKIKRGKAAGADPDGNNLLPNVLDKGSLAKPIAAYTKVVLEPNLSDVYDPRTESGVLVDGADIGSPTGISSLHVPTTFATDGGTSGNILGPDKDHTLTLEKAAAKVSGLTAINAYPVSADKLTLFSTTASAPLSSLFTTNKFADVKIGSVPAVSKGKLINKDEKNANLPDGNTLLPTATAPAKVGGFYIKAGGKLNSPISDYTTGVVSKNLYKPDDIKDDDKAVVENVKTQKEDFFGPKKLYKPDPGPIDAGAFDNIVKDPGKKAVTKETLFNYFKDQVNGVVNPGNKNVYAPTEPQALFSTVEYGSSKPVSTTAAQASQTDPGMYAPAAVPSSYSTAADPGKLSISRGKSIVSSPAFPDGNTLLRGSTDPKLPASTVNDYVSAVLKKNRFQSETSFNNKDLSLDPNQALFSNKYNPGSSEATSRDYNFRRLAQVGSVLQLRAAGEIPAVIDEGVNPNSSLTQLGNLLPGVGQLDIPRSVSHLDVNNVIASLNALGSSDERSMDSQFINPNENFEGIINSAFEKFSGFSALGMIALSVTLFAAVGAAIEGLGVLFNNSGAMSNGGAQRLQRVKEYGRYGIGSFYGGNYVASDDSIISLISSPNPSNVSILFGVTPTRSPFKDAVNEGIKSFFGIDLRSPTIDASKVRALLENPGYNVVITRTVVRSAVRISLALKDAVVMMSTANALSGLEQLMEVFGMIKHSKFIGALNTFAQVGDLSMNYLQGSPNVSGQDQTIPGIDAGQKISYQDSIIDTSDASAFSKSRLQGPHDQSSLKLAWATNRAPSMLMIPKNTQWLSTLGATSLGSAGDLITHDPLTKLQFESENLKGGRITTKAREAMEEKFDSEYIPFYFHDLRTNELIGFHAFLTSLTDDYQANYDSVEGLGRVDPIKIYKNTHRKIGLSFLVAALDQDDFQDMWVKINKLTTLVYPQYTEGQSVTVDKNYTFTKPFTQAIGASPMIRLRLGDLFTNNYSKFNLAGIFGATLDQTKINGKSLSKLNPQAPYNYQDLLPGGAKFYYKPGDYTDASGTKVKLDDKYEPVAVVTSAPDTRAPGSNFKFKVSLKPSTTIDPVVGAPAAVEIASSPDRAYSALTPESIINLADRAALPGGENIADASASGYATDLADFLKEENNAISRSFRSVGGKGLAGFIDSMNFDWYDKATWEITLGSKAPKMCKVTIAFTPIHDISPGLDVNGYNRAPIYNVRQIKI